MKRNVVQLLGIAFIVAIICTGIFYGLVASRLRAGSADTQMQSVVVAARDLDRGTVLTEADVRVTEVYPNQKLKSSFAQADQVAGRMLAGSVRAGEAVLAAKLVPISSGGSGAVPSGMRAVSLHVAESSGLISLLRAGQRVDVQAVTEQDHAVQLRTVLQDVEVLSVAQPDPAAPGRGAIPVITVLVRPLDEDVLALADAGARIRLALRNPLDHNADGRRALTLASLFGGARNLRTSVESAVSAQTSSNLTLPLRVRVIAVPAANAGALDAGLAKQRSHEAPDVNLQAVLRNVEAHLDAETVQSVHVIAGETSASTTIAAKNQNRFRLRVSCANCLSGRPTLNLRPELTVKQPAGIETRSLERSVQYDGSSTVVMRGVRADEGDRTALAQLFPNTDWKAHDLFLVVQPETELAAERRR